MEKFKDFKNRFYLRSETDKQLFDKCQLNVVNPTYNTKIKEYPDGSKNFYYAPTDIYGRSEYTKFKHHKKNVFQLWLDQRKQKFEFYKFQNEYFKTLHLIEVYFNSANDYLSFCSSMRLLDERDKQDFYIMRCSNLDITVDEQSFLNSLKSNIRHDNLKRAKDSIYDLVYSNDWTYFFTGTFNKDKIDRYNADVIKKPLQKWLNNLHTRYGCSYLIIFEHHKKDNAIHIHGLLRESPLKSLRLKESGTKSFYGFKKPMKELTAKKHGLDWSKGQEVYNLRSWSFGFSTAIKVYGDRGQLSNYITKYITKDNEKIMGRYYWHSRDLKKPLITYNNVSQEDISHLPAFHGWRFQLLLSDSSK